MNDVARFDRPPRFGSANSPWSYRASLTPRKTWSAESKIVYKRKKHLWSEKDIERISKAIEKEKKEDFGWFETIINFLADHMLAKILAVLGFDDELAKVVWRTIMSLWMKLMSKFFPDDARFLDVTRRYEEAMRIAIEERTRGLPEWQTNLEKKLVDAVDLIRTY